MDFENKIETKIHERFEFVFRYLRTLKAVSVRTDDFFKVYYSQGQNDKKYVKPGIFLLINLIIANIIFIFFGGKLSEFPIKNVLLNEYVTTITYLLSTYFFGYLLFLWLLTWFSERNSSRPINFKNCFDLICYGSFAYLAMALCDGISFKLCKIPLSKLTNIVLDTVANNSEINLNGIDATDYLCFFIGFLLSVIPVYFWWIKVICGLKNLLIDRPNKVLFFPSLIYWGIKISILCVLMFTMLFSEMQSVKNLTQPLSDELKKDKPNKLIVWKATGDIYQEKKFPIQVRYKIGLINLACACEIYFPSRFEGMFKTVYDLLLKGQDYDAELLIREKIRGFREKNLDQSHQLYLNLNEELKSLEELKNSDESPDVYGLTKQTNNLIIKTADLKRIGNTKIFYSKKPAHWAEDDKLKIKYSICISYPIFQIFPL